MLSEEWVYLDTYIEDTFDNGEAKEWWDESFRREWRFNTKYPPNSGDYVAIQRDNHTSTKLTKIDENCFIEGCFDLHCGLKFGSNNNCNSLIKMVVMNTSQSPSEIAEIYWYSNAICWEVSHGKPKTVPQKCERWVEINLRILRGYQLDSTGVSEKTYDNDIIRAYYKKSGSTVWEHFTDLFAKHDGKIRLVTYSADHHGWNFFRFQADEGFPHSNDRQQNQYISPFF